MLDIFSKFFVLDKSVNVTSSVTSFFSLILEKAVLHVSCNTILYNNNNNILLYIHRESWPTCRYMLHSDFHQ